MENEKNLYSYLGHTITVQPACDGGFVAHCLRSVYVHWGRTEENALKLMKEELKFRANNHPYVRELRARVIKLATVSDLRGWEEMLIRREQEATLASQAREALARDIEGE